jgi:TPR repeat protein
MLYLDGIGVEQDLQKAQEYIKFSANAGIPNAMNVLGDCYYSGTFGERNVKIALTFYKKAAAIGFGPAQFNAGIVMYKTSEDTDNLTKAIRYLDAASKNKNDLGELTKVALLYRNAAKIKLRWTSR